MRRNATLYFHFPCFDGLVSSILASNFMERHGCTFKHFCPVNYDLREKWISTRLRRPCAVVDFLYHPDAGFWADHHSTTFLSGKLKEEYEKRKNDRLLYDSASSSCAILLWKNMWTCLESERAKYEEMVCWADKIDSARYADVTEAILGKAPALQINRSLLRRSDEEYSIFLIQALREKSLSDVAQLDEVSVRAEQASLLIRGGLDYFRRFARLEAGEIVVSELEVDADKIISRYAPFYFFPQARYSIVLLHSENGSKITAMRNPWNEFPSVPLGDIFALCGGGGHDRVGSVILARERSKQAETIVRKIVDEIQRYHAIPLLNLRRALA